MDETLHRVLADQLKTCGATLRQRRLVWGTSGNISCRLEADLFLISASGSELGRLKDRDLARCRISQDSWEGTRRPSMEVGLHRSIYGSCPEAGAVIHSQPFYATLVACSDLPLRADLLPESMAYVGAVARVPYSHAGSRDLARSTADRAVTSKALLLDNHGAVCWGGSLDEALLRTEALEFLCRLLVAAHSGGISLNCLGDRVMNDFLQHLRQSGAGSA